MDVVIVDIPPKYGMLLSRSWGTKLGISLQRDMTYTTIPIFGGQFTRLYWETRLTYTVSDPCSPNNYPIYITNQYFGNCILSIDDDIDECVEYFTGKNQKERVNESVYSTGTWKMYFDGASSCEGAVA